MLSREIFYCSPAAITIVLEERQRQQQLDVSDLIPSIREKGIMLPLLVEEGTMKLRAGWRRHTAATFLNLAEVPYRLIPAGTSDLMLMKIEWEENAKRKDLTWQDNARAQWALHRANLELDPSWTTEKTASFLGQSESWTLRMLDLGEACEAKDAEVLACDTGTQAHTLLVRRRARNVGEAMNRILELDDDDELEIDGGGDPDEAGIAGSEVASDYSGVEPESTGGLAAGNSPVSGSVRGPDRVLRPERKVAPPYAIAHADAHEFLAGYSGPKFNFLHCDLPYGVGLNGQASQAAHGGGGYESSPDIYWELCQSICDNWDKFMYPSSHVMFWISMKFYEDTIEFFNINHPDASLKINPTPLIWHKTDNKGIIADHLRGPRNVYEAALIMSTGDRHLVRPTSNVYGCPTAKGEDAIHANEKPEPMLRYFMQMFVDGHSRVLDPTCGSGSSIRTAESLGAEAALGLEFNPEFADRAQRKLLTARGLASLSAVVNSAAASSALDINLEDE